jgi:hypothetical protein
MDYVLADFSVKCSAGTPVDQPKVAKLDALLNLSSRWTTEFKAEYAKQQGVLSGRERRRIARQQPRQTQQDIEQHVKKWKDELLPSEPHHEVHDLLGQALMDPARVQAWCAELASIT